MRGLEEATARSGCGGSESRQAYRAASPRCQTRFPQADPAPLCTRGESPARRRLWSAASRDRGRAGGRRCTPGGCVQRCLSRLQRRRGGAGGRSSRAELIRFQVLTFGRLFRGSSGQDLWVGSSGQALAMDQRARTLPRRDPPASWCAAKLPLNAPNHFSKVNRLTFRKSFAPGGPRGTLGTGQRTAPQLLSCRHRVDVLPRARRGF